jgi:hypothetical protein
MKLLKEQQELFCLILIVSNYILWFELIKLINEDTASITYTMLATDKVVASALVRQGMILNAPYAPSYAMSIRVLELYWNLHGRCPHLSIQPFMKGLLDVHGVRLHHPFETVQT